MSKQKLTPEKRNVIANLPEAYDIKSTSDLQDALKDLLGSTIQEMLEAELDEDLYHFATYSIAINLSFCHNASSKKSHVPLGTPRFS